MHLGPPGYGETPDQDRRDTIVVLVLRAAVRVCPDTTGSVHGPSPARVRRLQLVQVPHSTLDEVGRAVTAYGSVEEATWGGQYTPFILRADSSPALRTRRAPQRSAVRPAREGVAIDGVVRA